MMPYSSSHFKNTPTSEQQLSDAAATKQLLSNISNRFVKIISEQVNIAALSNQCCKLIAEHLTHQIKVIVERANKLAIHSRRKLVTIEDVNETLSLFGKDLIFGHNANGVHESVIYKSISLNSATNGGINSNSRHDNDKLFVSADDYQSVDLMNLINNQSQKFPQRLLYKAHWLIYEGEQPSIVQNAVVIPEKSSVVEEDSEENADDISTTSTRESSMLFGASVAYRESLKKIRKFERINVKPTSTYLLSLEQQRFFKEIMEACVGLDDKRRMEALESLQLDTSLQSLLPNISRWLAQGVHANIVQRSLAMLIYIVRAHSALIHNRSLNLKPVLHEMIPSLLSCMISKQLCVRPDIDNHWTLRDFASKCLVQLIRERGGICDVRNRVQRTLAVCFTDAQSTENMKYGAFHALFDLSNTDQRVALYPHFVEILRAVHPSKTSSMPQQQKIDSTKLYTLLSRFEQAMNKYATMQSRIKVE